MVVAWSPDASKLVFISDRGGSDDIWVVEATGGAPRQLTNWPGTERTPVWSADGSELFFSSDRDATWGDIWRVPVAGGTPVRVTTTGRFLDLCTQARTSPVLLGLSLGAGPDAIELVRVDPDGSVQTVWNQTTANCGEASPSSDSLVVNVGGLGGAQVGMVLPVDGGVGRQPLPPGQLFSQYSPDGSQVVYRFRDGNQADLGVLTLADGSTRRLTTTAANEGGAEWSPDGSEIVFLRSVPVNRITTADLTKLLGAKH